MASKYSGQEPNWEIFKGNQFTSSRGLLLWPLLILGLAMLILRFEEIPLLRQIVIVLFAIGWFFALSFTMHYFMLSDQGFIIKNHNYLWKHKVYKLEDIQEISFETDPKQGHFLRITTKNSRSKVYLATTLRDKTWLLMKEKLEQKGIIVRYDIF